jgi:lactoylglutathione lyase|tara:strand:+ start:126 stop:521 length:396 start_codon:yes stop_codon:yes gene_type:complete
MAKMIHSMVRVSNEERSVKFYSSAFSLNVVDRLDFDDFVLVYMSNSETDFELELTINKSQTEPYNLGDGYGHIAFSVSDVSVVHADLKKAGLLPRDLVDFKNNGETIAKFFFISDPDGYEIEVLEQRGRFK